MQRKPKNTERYHSIPQSLVQESKEPAQNVVYKNNNYLIYEKTHKSKQNRIINKQFNFRDVLIKKQSLDTLLNQHCQGSSFICDITFLGWDAARMQRCLTLHFRMSFE